MQNRERHARRRNLSMKETEPNDEHTTSDRVYSRALERTTLNPPEVSTHNYRTALSVPDASVRRTSAGTQPKLRLSESGHVSDSQAENGHVPEKSNKPTVEPSTRPKKLSFLSARRRASYFPSGPSVPLSDDQKRKRDVIWPLKRSYSFDTPFHRETIEAMNKGTSKRPPRSPLTLSRIRLTHHRFIFVEQEFLSMETCK